METNRVVESYGEFETKGTLSDVLAFFALASLLKVEAIRLELPRLHTSRAENIVRPEECRLILP